MPVKFRKVLVADERYESADVCDVDGDGVLDIISGGFWYQGPDFRQQHRIGDVMVSGEYYDDFCTIPLDVNGNGRLDFVSGGWFGKALRWHENPEDLSQDWPVHEIAECGPIETARGWDVDGDGHVEVVPNTPGGPLVFFKLVLDENGRGTGEFTAHTVYNERPWIEHAIDLDNSQYHDMQWVDIDGDGQCELITGKRYRAHSGKDPGATDPAGVYYFTWDGDRFTKQVIDWGPLRVGTGCGIYFAVADLNGDGRLDVVAPGKDGLYVFFNEG